MKNPGDALGGLLLLLLQQYWLRWRQHRATVSGRDLLRNGAGQVTRPMSLSAATRVPPRRTNSNRNN